MGSLGKVIQFIRTVRNLAKISDVIIDPGGGANKTAVNCVGIGDDSYPLATDYAAAIKIGKTGNIVVVGYLDPKNDPVSLPGEKRIYSRQYPAGSIAAEIYLKNTGEIEIKNDNGEINIFNDGKARINNPNGTITLEANGSVDVNGTVIDNHGIITGNGAITGKGITDTTTNITLWSHTHPGPGAPPTPGT